MDQPQQSLDADNRSMTDSQTRLLVPQRGVSNSRAMKIAGLTTLVCALLASQIFTAVMVLDQNKQIENLQRQSQNMGRDLTLRQRAVAPAKMQASLRTLPMLAALPTDIDSKKHQSLPKAPTSPEPSVSLEELVKGFIQDFDLPAFNNSLRTNLEGMRKTSSEDEWKNFESWMRYWLIFRMAQKKSDLTECQEKAGRDTGKVGTYKPQCDEQGGYKSRQCWTATGFCWCVDKSGKPIEGTTTRGWPQCA